MGQISHLRRSRSLGPAVICGLAALLYFGFADAASAATVTVCPVGGAQTTIQAGVNAAAAGRHGPGLRRHLPRAGPDHEVRQAHRCRLGADDDHPAAAGDRHTGRGHGRRRQRQRRCRDQRLHDQRPRPDRRVRVGSDDVLALRHLRPRRRERQHPRQRDHRHARRPARRLPERVGNQGRSCRHPDLRHGDDHEQHDLRLPEDRDHRRQRRLGRDDHREYHHGRRADERRSPRTGCRSAAAPSPPSPATVSQGTGTQAAGRSRPGCSCSARSARWRSPATRSAPTTSASPSRRCCLRRERRPRCGRTRSPAATSGSRSRGRRRRC